MPEGNTSRIVAIVLARGGSKGIPGKNLIQFCGKPLLQWTLEQLKQVKALHSIWVSSDSDTILQLAGSLGCGMIRRSGELAGDRATSESGWNHALDVIEDQIDDVDLILAPQATSPLRLPSDFDLAIRAFDEGGYDSMFSASPARDLCLWSRNGKELLCESYDRENPVRRRQETFGERWIENGSFYLFRPEVLLGTGTRFGASVGIFPMAVWKMFEIDDAEDLVICESLMKAHLEGRLL